ncbi:MAG: ATP-binding protein [Oscillochloridaceae bacterium umkhey_bin13]
MVANGDGCTTWAITTAQGKRMGSDNNDFIDRVSFQSIDSLPIRETHVGMLNMEKVKLHVQRAIDRKRYSGPNDIDNPTVYLLNSRCLINDNDNLLVTPAGLLSFGYNPQEVLPHAVVNITHYRGTVPDSTDAVHIERNIGGTIFDQLARVEDYLFKNTHHGMTIKPGSFERVEIDEYPAVVMRELSVNMLAHRDYKEIHSAARVQLFANHIEWMNPGGLPEGVTIERLLVAQKSRNPMLFSILWESGLIEGVGQGLDTVVAVLAREQMQAPQFQDLNHTFFVATVMGRPLETFYASDIYSRLSDRQRRILAIIRAQGESSTNDITTAFSGTVTQRSVQRDIKELLAVGLIRSVGGSHATRYRLFDSAPEQTSLPL